MEDFRLMCLIMNILLSCEDDVDWRPSLLAPETLAAQLKKQVTLKKRDATLFRMQEEGLICGVEEECYIGDEEPKADLSCGRPRVTIKGLEFKESNSLMKKAGAELKDAAIQFAGQVVTNIITKP